MDKLFNIKKSPYMKGQQIFDKNLVRIHEGITVLVGCNGSGKTSMLRQMRKQLKDENAAVLYYDYAKVRESKDRMLQDGEIPTAQFASWVSDSEGEQIVVAVSLLARSIGAFVRGHAGEDIYILADAIDSGLSIDNIDCVKRLLFATIVEDVRAKGHHAYVIVTANSYEMAAGVQCIEASTCQEKNFSSYGEYRQFILLSAAKKENRDAGI